MAYQDNTGFISDLVTTSHAHLQDGSNHVIHTGIIKALNIADAGSFIAHGMNIDSLSTGKFNISAGGFFRNGEYIEFSEATNATPPSSGATVWEGDSGYDWYGLICIDTSNNVVFRRPAGSLGAIKVADPTSGDIPLAVVQVLKDSDYAATRKFQFLGIKKTSAALTAGVENSGAFDENLKIGTDGKVYKNGSVNAISFPTVSGAKTLAVTTDIPTYTFGIADTNLVKIDDADAADNDYAKFTSSGLEGRSYAEVKSDLGLVNFDNDGGGLVPSPASSGTTVKFLREDGSWQTPAYIPDTNTQTTYTSSWVDPGNPNALLRLTAGGAGSGTQDIEIEAGENITLTPSGGNSLEIKSADTNTTYPDVTATTGGVLTNAQAVKFDGISTGAGVPRTDAEINTLANARIEAVLDVDGAATGLQTLADISDALNDDDDYAAGITAALGLKAPLASPTFTGTIAIPGISNLKTAVDDNTAKTTFPGFGTTAGTALVGNTAIPVDLTVSGAGTIHTANYTDTGFRPLGTGATDALAGNTTIDNVSAANLKTVLAAGFPDNAVTFGDAGDDINILGDLLPAKINSVAVPETPAFTDTKDWNSITGKPTTFAPIVGSNPADALAGNTTTITGAQATAISNNTAKVSYVFDSATDLGTSGDITTDLIPIYDADAAAGSRYKSVKMKDFLTKITANQLVSGGSGTGTIWATLPASAATVGAVLGTNMFDTNGSTALTAAVVKNANTNWSDVSGTTNAPANNATVGAVLGTNIFDTNGSTALTATQLLNTNTTAADVDLGNVTNESKATMFTAPEFTTSIKIGDATISEAELEILDGATVTTAELNILYGVTADKDEINILTGGLEAGDIPDLSGTYLTSFTESNNLGSAVTWANVPDANITKTSVAQHFGISGNNATKYLKMTTNGSGVVNFVAQSDTDFRSSIGAGTSSLSIGDEITEAMAGNTVVTNWSGGNTGLTASTGRTSLGATTFGAEVFTLADTDAVRFLRMDADNGVSALTDSLFRTALGATTLGSNIFTLPNISTSDKFLRLNYDGNTVSALSASDFRSAIGASAAGASNFATGDITGADDLGNNLASDDSFVMHDTSESALREMTVANLTSYLNSASILTSLAPITSLAWGSITNRPTTFAPVVGSGAGDALAGNTFTSAEITQMQNIDATTISATQWGYLGAATGAITNTDTHRAISSTPTEDASTTSISSDWAFDNVKVAVPSTAIFADFVPAADASTVGIRGLVPAPPANTFGTVKFLKQDGNWAVPTDTNTQLTNAEVTGMALTNLSVSSGADIIASDTILGALGKMENRIRLNDDKITNTDTNVSVANLKTALGNAFGSNAVSIGTSATTVTVPGNLTVAGDTIYHDETIKVVSDNTLAFRANDNDGTGEVRLTAADPDDVNYTITLPAAEFTLPSTFAPTNADATPSWVPSSDPSYLTSQTSHADVLVDGDFSSTGLMKRGGSAGSYSIVTDNSGNWDTAYGWGNHASAGYLTSLGTAILDGDFSGTTGLMKKSSAGTYTLDTSSYITDYTVTQSDVTDQEDHLTITESQISDLGTYLTSLLSTLSCTTVNNDATVTTADTDSLVVGMLVAGTGIPANTTISSIDANTTHFELSANATIGATNTLIFVDGISSAANFRTAIGAGSSTDNNDFVDAITADGNKLVFSVSGQADVDTASLLGSNAFNSTAFLSSIAADSITYDMMQDLGTANRLLGGTATGSIGEVQVATDMIAAGAVTVAKMADMAANTVLMNNTASAAAPIAVSKTDAKTFLDVLDWTADVTDTVIHADNYTDTQYATATSGTAGLVKIGYTESGKNYPIELSSGMMFVNVPWTDADTIYTHPNHTGEVTSVGHGALTITDSAITTPKIADTATSTLNCNTTNTDATVTTADTTTLLVGMMVSGTGIPADTTIDSITNGTTFELSNNATATNTSETLTFVKGITTAKIAPNAIITAKIVDDAITTAKIANGAVTLAKTANIGSAGANKLILGRTSNNAGVASAISAPMIGLITAADAAAARSAISVDEAGTQISTDVTLDTSSYDYLSLSGQAITLGQIVAGTDISGLATVATSGSYANLSDKPDIAYASAIASMTATVGGLMTNTHAAKFNTLEDWTGEVTNKVIHSTNYTNEYVNSLSLASNTLTLGRAIASDLTLDLSGTYATKAYADAIKQGLDTKDSVRLATTADGTLATAYANGQTVDGATLATGNRILIKNQSTASENGIYTVNASGAPTRATDADADADVTSGLYVWVEDGTTNGDTGWILTNTGSITVGSTNLVFTQFSGAGQITASGGLTKAANTLTITLPAVGTVLGRSAEQDTTIQELDSDDILTIIDLENVVDGATPTNTANVTAAGALMDSELTGIAHVKALNQSLISGATPTFTTTNFTDATNKRFMTDAQETKLDSVASGAQVNVGTNLGITGTTTDRVITSSTGDNVTIPVATASVSGVMSKATFDAVALNTAKTSNIVSNLAITGTNAARAITNSDGTGFTIPVATSASGTNLSGVITPSMVDAITANTAKVTFPGLGTSSGTALEGDTTIDDVSKANLLARLDDFDENDTVWIGDGGSDTQVNIRGNLSIRGTTSDLEVYDNMFLIGKKDENVNTDGGSLSDYYGIEVEAGKFGSTNLAHKFLRYNTSISRWEFTNNGSTYFSIPVSSEYGSGLTGSVSVTGSGNVPESSDFARFTGGTTLEGLTVAQMQSALSITPNATTNTGTVTSVTTGILSGLDIADSSTTPVISLDLSEISTITSGITSTDHLVVVNEGAGQNRITLGNVSVSAFADSVTAGDITDSGLTVNQVSGGYDDSNAETKGITLLGRSDDSDGAVQELQVLDQNGFFSASVLGQRILGLNANLVELADAGTIATNEFLVGHDDNGLTRKTPSEIKAILGGTTVGQNIFTLPNISTADKFIRLNYSDNSVSALTAAQFKTAIGADTYTHPTHDGDDIDIDMPNSTALTGAYVISDLDLNVTTDTLGHVTDANATIATRQLSLNDLGFTGSATANNYTHPTYDGDDIDLDTTVLSGQEVISDLDFNITTDTLGHVTDANASFDTRQITLSNLGYSGAVDANNYSLTSDLAQAEINQIKNIDNTTITATQWGYLGASNQASFMDWSVSQQYDNIHTGNYSNDDVSNANLLTKLAALESAGGATDQNITIGTDAGDTIVITGNLQVSGTTTTIDSTTVALDDHNIVLDKGNSTSAVVDGAGFTLEGGSGDDVTLQWLASGTKMELKKGSSYANLKAGTIEGALTGDVTGNVTGNTSGTAATVTEGVQSSITNAANLTTIGTLGYLNVDLLKLNGSTLSTSSGNTNINITPHGTGSTVVTKLTATDAVLTTPNLGTPSAINLTNATNAPTWNQSTSGTAATATLASTITVADESTDTTCFPLFATAVSGSLAAKTGTNLTFNSATGILTATGFAGNITGALTGSASAIDDGAVSSSGKFAEDVVDNSAIGDNAVNTPQLADYAVEEDQLNAGAVSGVKIQDSAVTGAKISAFESATQQPSTTLDGAIDEVATTIVLTSGTGFPEQGILMIGSERIKYKGINNDTDLTVLVRGHRGTTAAGHADDVAVKLVPRQQITLGGSKTLAIEEFDGADSTSAAVAGLVPIAGTADTAKFLRGDGAWASASTSGMTSFTLTGDSGTNQSVADGNTVDIAGGTGLSSVVGATDTVTLNLDNTAVTAGSYTNTSITVDAQGRLTSASSGSSGSATLDTTNDTTDANRYLTFTTNSATTSGQTIYTSANLYTNPADQELFINGPTSMLGVAKHANGSAGSPSLTFTSDTNTGMYRGGTDILGFSTAGTERMTISAAGVVNIAGSLTVAGSAVGGATALDGLSDVKFGGTDFTNSMKFGSTTTGTLSGAINNTIIGDGAGDQITSSSNNVLIGRSAGYGITSGGYNIGIGSYAAQNATTHSIHLGYESGKNATGAHNIGMGYEAIRAATGQGNIGIGREAGNDITSGADNTIIGYKAAKTFTTSGDNIAIGPYAMQLATSGWNIAIGNSALEDVTGNINMGIGFHAGQQISSGTSNLAIGYQALDSATTESHNIAIGMDALGGAVDGGEYNVAIGNYSGDAITSADNCVLIGHEAGSENLTSAGIVAVGFNAGKNATGPQNTFIGYNAGKRAATGAGQANVAIGYTTLQSNFGNQNTVIGNQAGINMTSSMNSIIGNNAARNLTSDYNCALGSDALNAATNAEKNVAIGYGALDTLSSGDKNTALGYKSGDAMNTGSSNIMIGNESGDNITSGSNNVVIGKADVTADASDQLSISSGDGSPVWITGTSDGSVNLPNSILKINGSVGSDGQVLTSTGSAVAWEAAGGGGASVIGDLTDVLVDSTNEYVDGFLLQTNSNGSAPTTGTMVHATGNIGLGKEVFEAIQYGDYNIAIGYEAGKVLTDGLNNVLLGYQSGDSITTAQGNILIGKTTGTALVTGGNNVIIGEEAGVSATASSSVFIGAHAAHYSAANTSGNQVAIGYHAGRWGMIGSSNTYIGANSGTGHTSNTTTASMQNTGVGQYSLNDITTGRDNSALGYSALKADTTGSYNTAFGSGALALNSTGTKNVAIGYNSGDANTIGFKNVFIGYSAGSANTDADHNVFVGSQAGKSNTTGLRNIAIGSDAYDVADTESDNLAIGYAALGGSINGGEFNVAIGNYAGDAVTSTDNATLIGYEAGSAIQSSWSPTAVGYRALANTTTASQCVALGIKAGENINNHFNVAVGSFALNVSTGGLGNTAIGHQAMKDSTDTASYNAFVGYNAGQEIDGNYNVGVGDNALNGGSSATGDYNTGLGSGSLVILTTGDANIALGPNAGNNITTGSNNVVIGAADVASATADSQLSISDGDGGTTWITGDSNGNVKLNQLADVITITGNTTLTQAQSGSYVLWSSGTLQLPLGAAEGVSYTIFNNTGSSATVDATTGDRQMLSGWADNAAVADNDATSYVCVGTDKWVQVGA